MNKHEIKDLIYKHFEPKDVGIGILHCIHEDKDVDKLAENLVNLFSIPVVSVSFLFDFVNEFTDTEIPKEAIKETLDKLNER